MTKRKGVIFSFTIFGISVLLAFFMAEAYIRVTRLNIDLLYLTGRRDVQKDNPYAAWNWAVTDAFAAYSAKPGVYGKAEEQKTVNTHGFISTPELPVAKPAGTIRIVFLGGSSTAGTGRNLADTETWPWRTVELLRQQFPDASIDFINGALGGYSSFESFGRLWSRIRFFTPDIIVVYHGWNEMYYWKRMNTITRWRVLRDGSWNFDRPLPGKSVKIYEPFIFDRLLSWSQILSRLRLRFSEPLSGEVGRQSSLSSQPPFSPFGLVTPAYADEPALASDYDHRGLPVWRTHLKLFKALSEEMGAELFVARQATLIVEDLPLEQQKRARYDLHGFDHDAHVDGYAQLYRIAEEEVPADHIIRTDTLSGIPELFVDHVHPTTEGARRIAEVVAQSLAQSPAFDPFRAASLLGQRH